MKDRSELKGGLETRKGGKVFDPYDDIKKACGCKMGQCKCGNIFPKPNSVSDSSRSSYVSAVAKLREMADEREAMFDGRTFKIVAAIALTDSIEEIRRVADLLEKED